MGEGSGLRSAARNPPAHRRDEAGQALEQSGFSAAIGAADGEQVAGRDLAGNMMHGGPPVIAKRHIFEYDFWRVAGGQLSAQNTPIHSRIRTGATTVSRPQADIRSAGGERNRASADAPARIFAHRGAWRSRGGRGFGHGSVIV